MKSSSLILGIVVIVSCAWGQTAKPITNWICEPQYDTVTDGKHVQGYVFSCRCKDDKCEFSGKTETTLPKPEPMVVEAIERQLPTMPTGDTCMTAEYKIAWCDNSPHYTCADKSRFLFHSEDGKRHVCVKFPEDK